MKIQQNNIELFYRRFRNQKPVESKYLSELIIEIFDTTERIFGGGNLPITTDKLGIIDGRLKFIEGGTVFDVIRDKKTREASKIIRSIEVQIRG